MRFGVGLSPFEIFNNFDDAARDALAQKLVWLDRIGIDELAILFDDMRSDIPELARTQAEIVAWVREHSSAEKLSVCPSYYSDDPVLDRVFGDRPSDYLATLGRELDPAVAIFWTGEEVCSREISPGHLKRIGNLLGRKPVLWDNYPVNDGERMSRHLHLRGFTGRPAANAAHLAGHGINPALQPTLTAIPAHYPGRVLPAWPRLSVWSGLPPWCPGSSGPGSGGASAGGSAGVAGCGAGSYQ